MFPEDHLQESALTVKGALIFLSLYYSAHNDKGPVPKLEARQYVDASKEVLDQVVQKLEDADPIITTTPKFNAIRPLVGAPLATREAGRARNCRPSRRRGS